MKTFNEDFYAKFRLRDIIRVIQCLAIKKTRKYLLAVEEMKNMRIELNLDDSDSLLVVCLAQHLLNYIINEFKLCVDE